MQDYGGSTHSDFLESWCQYAFILKIIANGSDLKKWFCRSLIQYLSGAQFPVQCTDNTLKSSFFPDFFLLWAINSHQFKAISKMEKMYVELFFVLYNMKRQI